VLEGRLGASVTRSVVCALVVSLLHAGALAQTPASCGTTADELRASQRLRARAQQLRVPSAPSAITRDVGQVAVMEHDGSSYARSEADGTPNYAPRAALAQRFYATHGDFYDFLVVFTNFEFETGDAVAFHNLVRNDVQGIGKPIVDNGWLFGSPGRLRGYVDMAALTRYGSQPLSIRPGVALSTQIGTRGFDDTLGVLSHEIGHQWLAQARYLDGSGQASGALLGRDGAHWSYLLDSDASFMYGADWAEQSPGQFRAERVMERYSALDLYLMGLLKASEVPPFSLLRNPAIDVSQLSTEGALVQATAETVTIAQAVAAMGARQPDEHASPKTFRAGFVLLTAPGVEPSAEDLEAVERVRRAFAGRFFALTRGAALVDTNLAEAPQPPPAATPDLDAALAWLLAHQESDGRFEDIGGSAARDTATVLDALRELGIAGEPFERGLGWLTTAPLGNTDYLSRAALARAPALDDFTRAQLLGLLKARQNRDGGFGLSVGYQSDPLDTALALRALAALGLPAQDAVVTRALVHLRATRQPMGWPAVPGSEISNLATAQIVLALQDYAQNGVAAQILGPAVAALTLRANPDGGFGESPSTPYATALALRALLRAGAPADAIDPAVTWLQSRQSVNGSWDDSRYTTALVLAALRGGITPNLTVPPDTLVLTPPMADEGQSVHVTARVRNIGRRPAGASRARLYDGAPSVPGHAIADADVPALEAGEDALVEFDFDTNERAGNRTLYVVADADGVVREAREDDNAASRVLSVSGRLPDLVLRPGGLSVDPYPPEDGETVNVSVVVKNEGELASPAARLRLFRGDPQQAGVPLAEVELPALAVGQAFTISVPWDTTGQTGTQLLVAMADADFSVDERDETNNELRLPVRVVAAIPPGPDLEIAQVVPDPPAFTTLPQTLHAHVLVRNVSRETVVSSVALYDGEGGPLLGELPVSLGPRSSTALTFEFVIASSGDRTLLAKADPADALAEPDEDNNALSALLDDPENTTDLEILAGDVVPSSLDVLQGETLTVDLVVRNHGTAAVSAVPVTLVHVTPTGNAELARALVDLPPGGTTIARLEWRTAVAADPLPLAVLADPFDLLRELNENNNRVSFSVRVRASSLPNLAVSGADLRVDPDPPREGAPATVSVVVRNPSVTDAGAFVVRFFRGNPETDGVLLGEVPFAGLVAGAQVVPSVSWPDVDVRGLQGLFAQVDPENAVEEYDETDNVAFRPFSAIGLPDLIVAAGDLTLEPGFPRAGQEVTVHVALRNLGGQPSAATVLRLYEGEPGAGSLIAELPVPAFQVGQGTTLSSAWTPSAPAGERVLAAVLDPGDLVREQSEGNNLARRNVVVQDASLYLTEPYFSPDGDGVKDETSLAWRTAGVSAVRVVVASARGKSIRTLALAAPPEGSASWDGRDDNGRLMWDGPYTFSLLSDTGTLLGRREVRLDTNHSPIHDAAGTGLTAVRNLTCGLPEIARGPAWNAAEDEAFFIIDHADASGDFQPGLVRVGLDGTHAYVGEPDAWWSDAYFAFRNGESPEHPVGRLTSPDGRELLVRHDYVLWAVDLETGARREIVSPYYGGEFVSWSPDGGRVLVGSRVYTRAGLLEGQLNGPSSRWSWSPDGRLLASGNVILRPDGHFEDALPLPDDVNDFFSDTIWLGDGRIFVSGQSCNECTRPTTPLPRASSPTKAEREAAWSARREEYAALAAAAAGPPAATAYVGRPPVPGGGGSNQGFTFLMLDPQDGSATHVTWLEDFARAHYLRSYDWSPDGAQVLFQSNDSYGDYTRVARESGSALRQLVRQSATVSPLDAVASWRIWDPEQACEDDSEHFALLNLLNLTADLQVSRLPANNGLRIRGTASDVHLDHWQLDYALESLPDIWRPLSPASDEQVVDDDFTVWVPDRPGRYIVRLRVLDRAGNLRTRVRVVNWDRSPAIVNATQSEYLISPNGDGRKDDVRFDYLVQEPTRLEVRVAGPERPSAVSPVVRRYSFEYPDIGPAAFTWDGRDEAGRLVPDGRYTVFLNELPFRVKVDVTPPDLDWRESPLRLVTRTPRAPARPFGVVEADLAWHVVDANLSAWQSPALEGTVPSYVPDVDAAGNLLFDERGAPRVHYENGRPANVRELEDVVSSYERLFFGADDRGANLARLNVPAREERLFLRYALDEDGQSTLLPPRAPGLVWPFKKKAIKFLLTSTAMERDAPIVFRYQPRSGGDWTELPAGTVFTLNFLEAGIRFGIEYRAEFVQRRTSGTELRSDTILFRLCDGSAAIELRGGTVVGELMTYVAIQAIAVGEPLEWVRLGVTGSGGIASFNASVDMALDLSAGGAYSASVLAPVVSCERPLDQLSFVVRARGRDSGRIYTSDGRCLKMVQRIPTCANKLILEQVFQGCSGDPDRGILRVRSETDVPAATVRLESGPEGGGATVTELPVGLVDVPFDFAGLPESRVPVRARLVAPSLPNPLATAATELVVDRTPPEEEILQPVENGVLCVAKDPATGLELTKLTFEVDDAFGGIALGPGSYTPEESDTRSLTLRCNPLDPLSCALEQDLPRQRPFDFNWNVTHVPNGRVALRQAVCDRSGNRSERTRNFELSKLPPTVSLRAVSRRLFSPNGDGRADDTTATFETIQSMRLSVVVRAGSPDGIRVRALVTNSTYFAGQHPFTWDGHDDLGAPVPDGIYFVVVSALDACGNPGGASARVEVDSTPPEAAVLAPGQGARLSGSVDVRGRARDPHFRSYELSWGRGLAPADFTSVHVGFGPVGLPPAETGPLGLWVPPLVPGPEDEDFTLRLVADDEAENVTEARVSVRVSPRAFLEYLKVDPLLFSPNGDGRLEETLLEYGLVAAGRVTLEVQTLSGVTVRRFESAVPHAAGVFPLPWDGLDVAGQPAPEGDLRAFVRVDDTLPTGAFQEQAVQFILDRTPPALALQQPAEDAFVTRHAPLRGSVADPRLVEWRVDAVGNGGVATPLGSGTEPVDGLLGTLDALDDGPYTLALAGADGAQNESSLARRITVDNTPPQAHIELAAGAVLRRGAQPIRVQGTAADLNLRDYVLSFGPGDAPAYFVEIRRATQGGEGVVLADWNVASLPDGSYTLRLEVTDKAGLQAETQVALVLDGTPPLAQIDSPAEGSYVIEPIAILGTASDANLESWKLEGAPGTAAQAFQFTLLAEGTSSITADVLREWAPLPADGPQTLRLTVIDKVAFSATATRSVIVDTTPPADPTGLVALVHNNGDDTGDVRVTWDANHEPDLRGYLVWRDGDLITPVPIPNPLVLDPALADGMYRYEVAALDLAGNSSGRTPLRVRVDLKPPIVDILRPRAGARVGGSVDIRGTAFSPDDFKEYRLYVGAGASPASFTLLRRSTLAVSAGTLGQWLAVGSGPYVIALEAEDVTGNQARTSVTVEVDNDPPSAPLLLSVPNVPEVTTLTPTWQPSPESDVAGYLVYRNDRIANAPGVVVGDLRPYLVPAPAHADQNLPDGDHCYRVVAMDEATNLSAPSNQICATLDNRPPHAVLVEPPANLRFDYPLHLLAYTPDLDVTQVQLQWKPQAEAVWHELGAPDLLAPYEAMFDPAGLAPGPYDLRALATDRAGHVDPVPESVTVIYGDATAPPTPPDVHAHVDGADIAVTWSAVSAPDLAGYHVYRDGERLTSAPVSDTSYADPDVALGPHVYGVTAVDNDDNESGPGTDDANVYALVLDQPYPVIGLTSASVAGSQARALTTIDVLRDGATIAQGAAAAAGPFQVDGVPLESGANLLRARGEDVEHNRSLTSDEIVLISNEPPPAVTGLSAAVTAHDVSLAWDAVADPEVVGYVVRRGNTRLTPSVPYLGSTTISATSTYPCCNFSPEAGYDGDPATAWIPQAFTSSWTVVFPEPVPVEAAELDFSYFGSPVVAPRYRIEALWEDRYLPLVQVRDNQLVSVRHLLPAPFTTTSLRVVMDSGWYVGFSELRVQRAGLVSGVTSFLDAAAPDGTHLYRVSAVDRYGAEGQPDTATAPVGDTAPPSAPTGLVATVVDSDVQLTWNRNPEPDVVGYVLLRDGVRIASVPDPAYLDARRPNGTYRYTVLAVDAGGLESPPSEPADATVLRTRPPDPPVITIPTDAAHPLTVQVPATPVRGRSDPGTLVVLHVNGGLVGGAVTAPALQPQGTWTGSAFGSDVNALSRDGRVLARTAYDAFGLRLQFRDLYAGTVRAFGAASYSDISVGPLADDGTRIAYAQDGRVFVLDTASGQLSEVPVAPYYAQEAVLSPDGTRVAYTAYRYNFGYQYVLAVRDLTSHETRVLSSGTAHHTRPQFAPGGPGLAVMRYSTSTFNYELRLYDSTTGTSVRVDSNLWTNAAASFSADGARLAYTTYSANELQVRTYDVATAVVANLTDGVEPAFDAHYDRLGRFLSYQRYEDGTHAVLHVFDSAVAGSRRVVDLQRDYIAPLDLHAWDDQGYLHVRADEDATQVFSGFDGGFSFDGVRLQSGDNTLVARAIDLLTGLQSTDSAAVHVTVVGVELPDLVVTPGDLTAYPLLPLVGQATQLQVQVRNVGVADAAEAALHVTVLDPLGDTVLDQFETSPYLVAGEAANVSVVFTPVVAGRYTYRVTLDEDNQVAEADEGNNTAERELRVALTGDLIVELTADRAEYPARTDARLDVGLLNAGVPFVGRARLVVETAGGDEVVALDDRPSSIANGGSLNYTVAWNTAATYAGDYRFALRVVPDDSGAATIETLRLFRILPDRRVAATLAPERTPVGLGDDGAFTARIDNRGVNLPLAGLVARFSLLPAAGGTAAFSLDRALPLLLPGAAREERFVWPAAAPAGNYTADLRVLSGAEALASAQAPFAVVAPVVDVRGTLVLEPADVMVGAATVAHVVVTNRAATALASQPFAVQVLSGSTATVLAHADFSTDLAPGQSRTLTLPLDTTTLAPGLYPVFLRTLAPVSSTLARARLGVHGALTPPSIDTPANGAVVTTQHPTLVVNDGASPEGLPLLYEFELFADVALSVQLPGVAGVPESPARTAWTVPTNLSEDGSYWWRARVSDGFSNSAWTVVASFRVDSSNQPPFAPIPDSPGPGAQVGSRDVTLVVRNARDLEFDPLVYDFLLASDPAMSVVVATATGVHETPGTTGAHLPFLLDEGATYWWQARARDAGGASPWFDPVSFTVDSFNGSPTAPVPLRPVNGATVATLTPELAVGLATDPEDDALTYTFQLDRVPAFDSAELQERSAVVPNTSEATTVMPSPLVDNTHYYWRARASDGASSGPWAGSDFVVNLGNDPPTAPVPLAPPDGGIVTTPTPSLRVRNASDADGDVLTYEFEVRNAAGVVAAVVGVPQTTLETSWSTTPALAEDQAYTWRARANDGHITGPWSTSSAFRVNAQPDPPTAPGLIAPVEGALLAVRRPALVVSNATSPEGLSLVYTFELYSVGAGGVLTLFDQVSGLAEGAGGRTMWTSGRDLPDGSYSWRARAADVNQPGPWMSSAHFSVRVDVPPAAPTGLAAVPGDARVTLAWNASPEPDVTGYRVYRGLTAGGPYTRIASVGAPTYLNTGLVNGTTYYYVVTALDAAFESGNSNQAAATPRSPSNVTAEVRSQPSTFSSTCLLCGSECNRAYPPVALSNLAAAAAELEPLALAAAAGGEEGTPSHNQDECPEWLRVTIELPVGYNPASIDVLSVRLNGQVAPDRHDTRLVDRDGDGLRELEVRFALQDVAPLLSAGVNTLSLTGRIGSVTFAGSLALTLPAPVLEASFTPDPFKRSSGQWAQVQLSFKDCGVAGDIETASLRLNGTVAVARVVSDPHDSALVVKFDRAAVAAVLPVGNNVEVRITGRVRGMSFVAVDHVKVIP
jgi:subtilase family serine protease/flagellar hook assembly protein FlgD/WD40 repeat protein